MSEKDITALAREYAEEVAKGTAVDALPNGLKENVIQRNADHSEKHLRWLLRRYCLVEKGKVEDRLRIASRKVSNGEKFKLRRLVAIGRGERDLLEGLFPEIGKEAEG